MPAAGVSRVGCELVKSSAEARKVEKHLKLNNIGNELHKNLVED